MAKDPKKSKQFFKSFKAELKKVTWPTPKQMVNNTTAVITVVLIIAAIVFVLDITFDSLNKYGTDKIKEKTQKADTSTVQNVDNTTTDNVTTDDITTDNTTADTNSATNTQ